MTLRRNFCITMPVRKIPISHVSQTGHHWLKRHRCSLPFESRLECCFLVLMDFDWNVATVEGQPVKVPWRDEQGQMHRYTPDFLVKFLPVGEQTPSGQHQKARPWLVEVKNEKVLKKRWKEFRPRFRAATRYARERGWTFRLFTDRIIHTPLLNNAQRLLNTLDFTCDSALCDVLLRVLDRQAGTTPIELVNLITGDPAEQTVVFRAVWRLIAQGQIGASLDQPLTLRTPLWRTEETSSSLPPQF